MSWVWWRPSLADSVLRPQNGFLAWLISLEIFSCGRFELLSPWLFAAVRCLLPDLRLLFDQTLGLAMKFRNWLGLRMVCASPEILRFSAVGIVAGQLAVTICVAGSFRCSSPSLKTLRRRSAFGCAITPGHPHDTVMLEPLG